MLQNTGMTSANGCHQLENCAIEKTKVALQKNLTLPLLVVQAKFH